MQRKGKYASPGPSLLHHIFLAFSPVLSDPSLSLAPVVHAVALKGTDALILQATELQYIPPCVPELLM